MKFGGTSVADAERIQRVVELVRAAEARRPVVVVSALGGVTDLLVRAIEAARGGGVDALEPILADLERRHRWALSGCLEDARRRHDASLDVDALFDDLRQLLRSVRILGEVTPRAADALLAFGETLSSRILTAALEAHDVPAIGVDPGSVIVTDRRFGRAEPDPERVEAACLDRIVPEIEAGRVPVVGGFIGATPEGVTTTLGRGGSDTSAAVLGAALRAEEIQIWTDVDGIMSADPRHVAEARTLPEVSFAEAAELAHYGAKVLHPASVESAVRLKIPVRILNTLRPEAGGTSVVDTVGPDSRWVASVASRDGLGAVRVSSRRLRIDAGFLAELMEACRRHDVAPDLVVSSEVAVLIAARAGDGLARLAAEAERLGEVRSVPDRALVSVVGAGLAASPELRSEVIAELGAAGPDAVAAGGSSICVTAVVAADAVGDVVRRIHRRFRMERSEP